MAEAIVDINFASVSGVARRTITLKATVSQCLAFALLFARVIEARIDQSLASITVIGWWAIAGEFVNGHCPTGAIVRTAVLFTKAGVAFLSVPVRFAFV